MRDGGIEHSGSRPRPAAPAGAANRSCQSWRAACGRGRKRYQPARPHAARHRPRPAPRPHTASRCTPPARTPRHRGRRTAPARTADAPGRPGRSGRAAPPRSLCRDSRRSAASGGYPARLRWASGPPQAPAGHQHPRANAYAVNRDASELRRSHARKAPRPQLSPTRCMSSIRRRGRGFAFPGRP